MKIICWNLKDIGSPKLTNNLSPLIAAAGLGGTVLDYIVKVVMAGAAWNNITTSPADVFVIIELVCGGKGVGKPAAGNATPTITTITQALNTEAGIQGLAATHHYAFVPLLLAGNMECVGIIYNDRLLTYGASRVLRNTNYLKPYAPFMAEFTTGNPATTLRIVGVHAPKPKGGKTTLFKNPINFSEKVTDIAEIKQLMPADQVGLCLMGDFNCNPSSTYEKALKGKKVLVSAFASLMTGYGYKTALITPTLTSCRQQVDNTQAASAAYLKAAYDNIFYSKIAGIAPTTTSLDTIGNARDMANGNAAMYPAHAAALLGEYWKVSDHMAVMMTF